MRHNTTITFNSKPAFFIGPKTTCANFQLQLSTDHASLDITSSIVIKIVSIIQPFLLRHLSAFKTEQTKRTDVGQYAKEIERGAISL